MIVENGVKTEFVPNSELPKQSWTCILVKL